MTITFSELKNKWINGGFSWHDNLLDYNLDFWFMLETKGCNFKQLYWVLSFQSPQWMKMIYSVRSGFQSCLLSQKYNGQSMNMRWFLNQLILEIFFFSSCSIPVSNISSWDWCLIDCTINLILWDKPPCILPPMSNKGWTAIYHWIWPITPPFSVVPMEGAVCVLQLARDYRGAERPGPQDPLCLFLAKAGMALGWCYVCSTDRLWHLALVIFVTKCLPAYVVGHNCHNLA